MPRALKYFIGILFVLRLAVSFAQSDGRLKSDSITYFGAVVNLGLNGSMSSIQPADEQRFSNGADPVELFEHLAGLRNPLYQPLPYQWLHTAIYAPILFFWRSMTPVVLINNLLFFGAGMLFFRAVARNASAAALAVGWTIYAFFPPLFYLTSNFFSEPLFLLLLGVIVLLIDKLGWEQFYLLFLSAAAISLTRPFGLFLAVLLAFYSGCRLHLARATGLAFAAGLAIAINAIVMSHAVPDNAHVFSVPAAETFYCSNTAEGNGDFDNYFVNTRVADRDSVLQRFRAGSMSGTGLIARAVVQDLRAPGRFVANSLNKLTNYFFGVVPSAWTYEPMTPQAPTRKYVWFGGNLLLFALAGAGLVKAQKHHAQLFLFIFAVGFVFHFFLLARYRYFLPVLAFAAAFIPTAVDALLARRRNLRQPNPSSGRPYSPL